MKYIITILSALFIILCLSSYSSAKTLYFPHVASGSAWETEICLINASDLHNLAGTLTAFNDAGQQLNTTSISLRPGAREEIIVGRDLAEPAQIGYMIFEADADAVIGYTKFYINSTYRVAVPASAQVNDSDIVIPHIASDETWWTGISLLNTTDADKEITIEFSNDASRNITIAAKEHKVFAISQLFNNQSQPAVSSAVIKNGEGLVGMELFGSNGGSENCLSGVLLKVDTTGSIYYPHIASDETWWTGIVAYNPEPTPCDLAITPYRQDGTPLFPQTLQIPGNSKYIGSARSLSLPEASAWLKIDAAHPITGFELFGAMSGNQLAGYTAVGISGSNGIFPKLEKNGWTGIAFVNIGAGNANVTITAYDDSGAAIDVENIELSGNEKIVSDAASLFSADISSATYLQYSSTSDIVGFQMNGSDDGTMLDALPADNSGATVNELLTSATIDSQGGTLAGGGFSLTIPAGTFASPAELKLYKTKSHASFSQTVITDSFRVTGLPDDFPETLLPDLQPTGPLSGESFIVVGEEVLISSQITPTVAYHLFPTKSAGGLLNAAPRNAVPEARLSEENLTTLRTSAANSGSALDFFGITGWATYNSGENLRTDTGQNHFLIRYPSYFVSRTDIDPLFQYLEEAYSTYDQMGFSYDNRTRWPLEVSVMELAPDTDGLFCKSFWGNNYTTLQFNQNNLKNLSELRTTAGHEFFHFIQYLYDTRGTFVRNSKTSSRTISIHWLNEAAAVWAEEKFSNSPNYVSAIRAGHEGAPLNGLEFGADANIVQAGNHGYGISAFIKYLAGKYGESIVRDIYLKILDQQHPIQAINLALKPDFLFTVWEPFLRDYLSGNIYGVAGARFTGYNSGIFRIQSDSDKSKSFTENYPDLSGMLFTVRLDDPDISRAQAITFTVDQIVCDLTLFKVRKSDTSIHYLSHSSSQKLVQKDLRSLTDDGCYLLIMVTNSDYSSSPNLYTNTKPIKLDILVESIAAAMTLNASPNILDADGVSASTITATVTDDVGDPVEGETVTFITDSGGLSAGSAETNVNGVAVISYIAPGSVPAGGVATITAATSNSISTATTVTLNQVATLSWPGWPEPQWCPKTGSYHIIYGVPGGPDEVYCDYDQGQLTYETPFVNDKRDGFSKIYNSIAYTSGSFRAEIPYVDGNKNGIERWYYQNGQLENETIWAGGKKNGTYREFYESGILRLETPYLDDKKSGIHKDYFIDGQLRNEWPYVNDQPHGLCKGYYASGQLQGETPYVNGQRSGLGKGYYESGQLHFEIPYTNNMINGTEKEYYESGSIKYETPHINDEKNGVEVYYYENGGHASETPWVNDVKHGQVKGFAADGEMISCENYNNGTYVSSCMP